MTDFAIIKTHIKEILDIPTYEKYINPLEYIGVNKGIVFLGSPEKNKMAWIKNNILTKINAHLKEKFKISINIVPLFEESYENIDPVELKVKKTFNSNLQEKFTFDTFTQTNSNRMAHSFAYNVSEYPGKSYNPLYIYSDVGLGKTHLMQAIGNRLKKANKNISVVYTTSSDFMNEYVEYTRQKQGTQIIKNTLP